MVDTILQHPVLTNFAYPFLLVFFIVFAVLEKSKLFGDGKKSLNAMVAFVIGLIFVGAVFPKEVVSNMVLFLSVALVIVFVVLILWGFVYSGEKGFELTKGMKVSLMIIISIAVVIAVLWATGVGGKVSGALFGQSWSSAFWSNLVFIGLIGAALAIVIRNSK